MLRRFVAAAIIVGFLGLGLPSVGFAQTTEAKQDLKKAKKKTKKAAKATGEAARDVGNATKATAKAAKRKATGTTVATCNDGTTYSGKTRRGACSGHGGVKSWGKA